MQVRKRSQKLRKMRLKKKESRSIALKIERYNRMTDTLSISEEPLTCSILPKITSIELFKKETFPLAHTYPSSFALIKSLPYASSQMVSADQFIDSSFPVLMYTVEELVGFSALMLRDNEYAENKFSQKTLCNLSKAIALGYNKVSYHNFSHAFALTQLFYHCMNKQDYFLQKFTAEECFYVMIAGLAHDINHKGTNNHFEVKKKSSLAVQFNNQSVLENMHLRNLWNILESDSTINIVEKASNPKTAKHIITRLILATDMSHHFNKVEELQRRRIQGSLGKDRWIGMEALFHACDIGNPTSSYENYINWAALLSHQFNQQALLEKQLELEVSQPLLYKDLSTFYKDQLWFVGNIVCPLWKELSLSWTSLEPLVKQIQNNEASLRSEIEIIRN